ncbi:MAG: hypothetical protein ACI861_000578 [Paracoccaceae bacterium]|jgi:hypothetical protein
MNNQIKALLRLTVQDPRAAAAGLLVDEHARANAIKLAILVVIFGVFASYINAQIAPENFEGLFATTLLSNPFLLTIIQFVTLMISVIAIHVIGRMFGGRGGFDQAILISAWLQFFTLMVQIALIPVAIIAPTVAGLLSGLSYVYFVWLMVNFIAELHGFRSLWKVLGGIVGASFAASFIILMFLGLFGVEFGGV